MAKPKIVTIGVYETDEAKFFQALVDAKVDTFCDIRNRRGMRGSTYSFVNSKKLQSKLDELGIRYLHIKELAPTQTTRDEQKEEDAQLGIAKRARDKLSSTFIQSFQDNTLTNFDSARFLELLESDAEVVALFCVERKPEACHRSLVAERLQRDLDLELEHLQP